MHAAEMNFLFSALLSGAQVFAKLCYDHKGHCEYIAKKKKRKAKNSGNNVLL